MHENPNTCTDTKLRVDQYFPISHGIILLMGSHDFENRYSEMETSSFFISKCFDMREQPTCQLVN